MNIGYTDDPSYKLAKGETIRCLEDALREANVGGWADVRRALNKAQVAADRCFEFQTGTATTKATPREAKEAARAAAATPRTPKAKRPAVEPVEKAKRPGKGKRRRPKERV